MNKFAWMLMIVGLSVFAIGCGGGEKSDSADGTTDKPSPDNPTTDEPSSDSPVKVKGGEPFDPSTDDLGTDNPPTTTDDTPKADATKKNVVPPPLDDGLELPAPNIDNPFKLPDDSTTKKDGDGNETKDG